VFLSPNAPFKYDAYPMGYQWFSLTDYTEDKLYEGIEVALPILEEYIDENLEKYQLGYKDLILIGFSQGTIMALQMAPRLPEACFAVIGFSGALVKGRMLEPNIKSKPPIFLAHGSDDQVLPISKYHLANRSLKEMGLSVEGHVIEKLGHGISLEGIELASEFLMSLNTRS
jgi:phospholipase/carboxylesterase